jgi:methylmalonyl-CoA epimerase
MIGQPGFLTFHHIGLLVDNIGDSIQHYADLFGKENVSEIVEVATQKVKVCFVKIGEKSYIELVTPTDEDSVVSKLLKKRVSYYHIGYKVGDIAGAVEELERMHYKPLEFFESEAFDGKKCIFLISPDGHLLELIEQ